MKIKKFNQLNESKFDDFIKEVEDYVNIEYEEGEEPTNVDMLSEVGEIMNKYELTTSDLQKIVDENPNNWEIQTYVKPQLDYEVKEQTDKQKLFDDIKAIIMGNKIDKAVEEIIRYFNDKKNF